MLHCFSRTLVAFYLPSCCRYVVVDTLHVYAQRAPRSEFVFNYSANSTEWAIRRHFPLASDCAGSPGKDLVG